MLVTYNSILNITALLPNLNATAPKNPGWKLEQRCSICADTVIDASEFSGMDDILWEEDQWLENVKCRSLVVPSNLKLTKKNSCILF